MFSCEFCEIFKRTFFTEHLRTTITTVECEILKVKKTSVKTIQMGLYSVFLNVPMKYVQEKEKRKRNLIVKKKLVLLSQLLFNCNIENQRCFFMSNLFLELISVSVNDMYFCFLLFVNARHDYELIKVKH